MAEDGLPTWTPSSGEIGQIPISVTQDINSTAVPPGQDANKLATQIVRENQPVINRFVTMQRQQVELGEKDVHNSVLPLKDLDVFYRNVGGIERLHYHITPKGEEPPAPPAQPDEVKPPTPPTQPEPEDIPKIETKEPELPEPDKPPEFEEPKLPEEEKPPEEELPKEEERKEEREAPEFLEIDIPCFLPVEFGAGAGDP